MLNSQSLPSDLVKHLHEQPRAYSIGTIANKHTKMMHLASLGSLNHERNLSTLLLGNQVVVNTTAGNQSGNRHTASGDGTIGEHDNFDSVLNGL